MSESATASGPDKHITETEFWNELMDDVFGPRSGGAIIFVDAENARKGVGKTSAAVGLARLFARAFDYELQTDDLTLSGAEYLRRYREHPSSGQPSVLVLDEFVGAGSGDARRAMSTQNVNFGAAWQMLRTKRVVTLATLPNWNEADPRLQKYADYRLWCREQPIGVLQPYKITVPFNAQGSGVQVRTEGLGSGSDTERIHFPNMDKHNDPYYQDLSRKKEEVIGSSDWDADALQEDNDEESLDPDTAQRRQTIKIALRLYEPWTDETQHSYDDVAAVVDKSDTWVGHRVREWRDGEHRDLVPDPREA